MPCCITGLPSIDVEALRARLYGEVYGPDDDGWDEARRAWNLAVDQRPAAVALPITDADVVEVVNFAREQGLRVAPQGTGHGAAAIVYPREHDPALDQAHARRADRPERPPRARPRRRASGRT